jgi:ubiquitin-conjugating enzyme E2 J2
MCDTSATFGSIETTNAEKRKFAYDSLAFNIQDPIFRELFPDITIEIKKILDERTARSLTLNSVNNNNNPEQSVVSSTLNSGSTSTSWFNNFIGNVMVLVLLAAFAVIVRFILNSTAEIQ